MRLPFSSPLLCAALATFLVGDLAVAKPKPMMGKRWSVDELEANRPDENYKPPAGFQDNRMGSDRTVTDPQYLQATRQSDAFNTAAEHATYLQAYQWLYGPYGISKDKKKRDELIKDTAAAIEDCLKNVNCTEAKQNLVLKALVQHNLGKETQRMALENRTNAENMKSLTPDSEKIFSSLGRGSSISGGKRRDADLRISSQNTKDPYFQLDAKKADQKFSPQELEALGPKFLTEYRDFVRHIVKPNQKRHYKYVEARPSVYTFEESTASEKDARVAAEQGSEGMKKMLDNHLEKAQPITFSKPQMVDGKLKADMYGENGATVGFGEVDDIVRKKEGGQNGELERITSYDRYPVYAQSMNKIFKDKAEEKAGEKANENSRAPAQNGGASMFQGKTPQEIAETMTVNVTLSPDTFNKFLDEIWPSSA
jgi:hypothetical protein